MQIDISYDSSANSAPSAFKTDISLVVSLLDSLFTNDVTVTIDVGYGEVDGMALASGDLGASNWGTYYTSANYGQVKSALLAESAPGSSGLPGSSPGQGSLYMSPAEAEALGFTNSVATEYVGFSNTANWSYGAGTTPPSNEYYFIGTVEHEITENLGRVSLINNQPSFYSVMDLFRYSSPGVRDFSTGGGGSTAYFSIDSGNTDLGSWNNNTNNGDLGDWYGSNIPNGGDDAFDGVSPPGVVNVLSNVDVELMEALGWTTYLAWSNTAGGNFTTASDWNGQRVPGASDTVQITATGTYTVISSTSETMKSLTVGSEATLIVSGGNFTVSGALSNSWAVSVDSGAGLYVGGAITGSGTLYNVGGLIELDSSDTNAINFNSGNGGEVLLAGSGSHSVTTAYNGGNAVVLDSSSAQSVMAAGSGNYDFYDEGSTNDYVGNTGNMSVAKNLGSGADQFYFAGNQNQLFGGSAGGWMGVSGNDNALVGSSGSYWIGATGSSNTLVAGSGSTTLYADGIGNYLYAGSGQDWEGVSGNSNQIFGGPGADWMGASGSDNALSAGTGNSTLSADGNSNTLSGSGGGNDWIGVSGNGNYLYGGAGNDYLAATGNNNVLNPNGAGTDTLVAGTHSNDQFVYHPGDGMVTIDNFSPSAGDVIDFAGWGITDVSQLAPYVSTSSDGSIMLNLGGNAHLTLEGIPGGLQNSWFNFHA